MIYNTVAYEVIEGFTAKNLNGQDVKVFKNANLSLRFVRVDGDMTTHVDDNYTFLTKNRGKEFSNFKNLRVTSIDFSKIKEFNRFGHSDNIEVLTVTHI